ncbi:Noc2-domain-containing protein [Suillus brevipes Sb2]|nr:Noc2-domain-containing protein [Suillus brevipes Sb2]
MGKAAKSSRKFAASGKLKQAIQSRKKHQQMQKKIQGRRGAHGKGKRQAVTEADDGESDDEEKEVKGVSKEAGKDAKKMTVEDLLGAEFMDDDADEDEDDVEGDGLDTDEDEEDVADDQSFASVDDLEDHGTSHMLELAQLAEKDPEFYKYLQENDRELLEFTTTPDGDDEMDDEDDVMDEDDNEEEIGEELPVLTTGILKTWQKALLEHRSLRALRKLLIAFRSAVHMNEDDQVLLWRIDNAAVYTKLVTTSLRYTPIVLAHHLPYKILPNGKFKQPSQSAKQKALQKLTLSYFNNVVHLITQLTDPETLRLALTESAKILPYVVSSRKAVKTYLKATQKCLELWSTGEDDVRIAAFLAIRKLASSTDDSIVDLVLKSTYLALVRACKSTSTYRLPSITLMKNSACELFCVDHGATYPHAFGYIRQLAILLRGGMKTKTKEAYKQVYNWQYAHCVDFWALVLGRACDAHAEAERGGQESELRPLIYPLVQVSLGAIKLISNSRSYPFHLHIARSMLHLTRHTRIYVPLTPYLLPIISSTLTASGKPKSSTLRPLDMETHIRAPAQYVKTRVYVAGLVEETVFLLAEWLGSGPVHGSVAFPELIVPITVTLRRTLKNCKELGKEAGMVKGLLERVEDCAKWIDKSRSGINFGPGKMDEVEQWEANVGIEESPLGKYLKVQRKSREKRKRMIDKANKGEDEILED